MGLRVSGRQLPPEHRDQADPGHQGKAQDPDVGEPVLRVSLLQHPLQRPDSGRQQADSNPVHLAPVPLLPGRIPEELLTRNADAMPIGTLMKKHQLQE